MGTTTRSLVSAVALASALLFFGPSTSAAEARHNRPYAPYHFQHHPSYGFARPYYRGAHAPSFRPFYRPYRVVRVFVYVPFPHWAYRRVYFAPPLAGSFYDPY